MNALLAFIQQYTHVPPAEWNSIQAVFEPKTFDKNEIILEEGKICRHFYFLESGLIRFFIHVDGNDISKFFTTAPYCFTSKDSFRNQISSNEGIQALVQTNTWRVNHTHANELLKLPSWNEFTRKFVHEVQSYTETLLMENKTQNAEQRYIKLMQTYPQLLPQIPLKHLSSFLGIEPQSLSRIRKKLSQ